MIDKKFSRRELMHGAAALGTATLIPQELLAQQAPRTASAPGSSLPARGELLIRGATVLTIPGPKCRPRYIRDIGWSSPAPIFPRAYRDRVSSPENGSGKSHWSGPA